MGYAKVVEKPTSRSKWRRIVGKRYFILKRILKWYFYNIKYSKFCEQTALPYSIFKHHSFLLRPLKNIDMVYQHNKVENLKIAITKLNGIIIKPGETFSLWYLVGNPSKNKGYKLGLTLSSGSINYSYGGGLCQMGNLIYWMALHSPLTVVERWRHSFDVFPDINRKLPFGSGATLSYNYIDLQLKNNTNQNFQIMLWLDDENLHGEIKSDKNINFTYEVYEKNHMIQTQIWGGYSRHNQIWRKIIDQKDSLLSDEIITENHAIMMYNPLLTGREF
ncbi:MAG: vancomycin resistance protein [Bacteroidetes bacterium RIFCSPLOWO2_12_FULL_31_6]|nr:MAG: vancomycin resistance protein [Bacteroidetes bacterium RIFCSPLOWO2_12_FULL_31_6]